MQQEDHRLSYDLHDRKSWQCWFMGDSSDIMWHARNYLSAIGAAACYCLGARQMFIKTALVTAIPKTNKSDQLQGFSMPEPDFVQSQPHRSSKPTSGMPKTRLHSEDWALMHMLLQAEPNEHQTSTFKHLLGAADAHNIKHNAGCLMFWSPESAPRHETGCRMIWARHWHVLAGWNLGREDDHFRV